MVFQAGDLDPRRFRATMVEMLHAVTIVLAICLVVLGLALARAITNWFADR